jgi:hypothetical protein
MTNEHDEHDDYLWTGEGAVSLEVAALERELRPLAWKPRELAVPAVAELHPVTEPRSAAPAANDSRGWTPIIAALAAAAAVFAVIIWLRGPTDDAPSPNPDGPTTQPVVQPAGRPSPDLKDPFADDSPAPSFPSPSGVAPNLKDPFAHDPKRPAQNRPSPDLKDPFAGSAQTPSAVPAPHSNGSSQSVDLADPFESGDGRGTQKPPRNPGKLVDPFTGDAAKPPPQTSPDLKDPFKR